MYVYVFWGTSPLKLQYFYWKKVFLLVDFKCVFQKARSPRLTSSRTPLRADHVDLVNSFVDAHVRPAKGKKDETTENSNLCKIYMTTTRMFSPALREFHHTEERKTG